MKWFINLSTRTKLFFGFGLIVFLLLAVTIAAYNGITTLRQSQNKLFRENFLSSVKLLEFRSSQNRIRTDLQEMAIMKDSGQRQALEKDIDTRAQELDAGLKVLSESLAGRPEELKKLEELVTILGEYRKEREEQISLINADRVDEAIQLFTTVQQDRHARIRDLAEEMGNSSLVDARAKIDAAEKTTARLIRIFLGIGVLAIALMFLLNRVIANPLGTITTAAARIAAGDLGVSIDLGEREDEVGRLTRAFSVMVGYLKDMAATSRQVAGGDLSVTVKPVSDRDILGNAFLDMTGYLREMAAVSKQVAGSMSWHPRWVRSWPRRPRSPPASPRRQPR